MPNAVASVRFSSALVQSDSQIPECHATPRYVSVTTILPLLSPPLTSNALTHFTLWDSYIGEFEIIDDHRSGKIVIQLNGRLNKTGVISPRFNVQVTQIESWVNLLLPSRGFGIIILVRPFSYCKRAGAEAEVSCSDLLLGILDHEEARRKNVGGKLLGYVY